MRKIREQARFGKDMELLVKRGASDELLELIEDIIGRLQKNEPLPASAKPHPLYGKWRGYRDLHILGDLVMIYKLSREEVVLVRIGDHSTLFKK
jgi:mRNA interferase YafQ